MKRVLALALAMVMALSLAACGGSGDTSTGDSGSSGGNVVRIGVFEPATGDSGPGGKQEMLGMQYANKETPTSWSTRTTVPLPTRRPPPRRSW